MRSTALASSMRQLSRIAARNAEAGGNGAVNTTSMPAFLSIAALLLSAGNQLDPSRSSLRLRLRAIRPQQREQCRDPRQRAESD